MKAFSSIELKRPVLSKSFWITPLILEGRSVFVIFSLPSWKKFVIAMGRGSLFPSVISISMIA